jgi:glutamate---cysteine ligase / carboxylate-amine ligase
MTEPYPTLTMGVEEEFYLVDDAGQLVQEAAGTVDDADEQTGDVDLKPELLRSQVESGSGVCRDHTALLADLTDLRERLSAAASHRGARLMSAGTVINEPADPHRVAAGRRYRRIAGHVGPFVVDAATCGCHVHVGVESREIAVAVSNHLRPWLPALLALSANSPFHHGADTGYASARYLLWGRWPTSGPPPYLASEEHYARIVDGLLSSKAALDRGMIYWDVRPSEHQPTVEIRVADAAGTAAESTLFGVLVRTLVAEALDRVDHDVPAEPVPHEVLRANLWRAARDGLEGDCADPVTGEHRPVHDILADLAPRCAGGEDEVTFAKHMLATLRRTGGGAARQRAAFRRRGCLSDVVELLVSQTV